MTVSGPDLCTTDTPDLPRTNRCVHRHPGDSEERRHQEPLGRGQAQPASSIGCRRVPGGRAGQSAVQRHQHPAWAKISLSDVDNSRGYEMTVTGSGFNNGTTAGVHVLANAQAELHGPPEAWWETLDCAGMMDAMDGRPGWQSKTYCFHYDLNAMDMSYTIGTIAVTRVPSSTIMKTYSDMVFTQHLCRIGDAKVINPTQANGAGVHRLSQWHRGR